MSNTTEEIEFDGTIFLKAILETEDDPVNNFLVEVDRKYPDKKNKKQNISHFV